MTELRSSKSSVPVEDGEIHTWFGLSYANYLVVPRSVLQSMPLEWQERFVKALREMHDTFPDLEWPPTYDVRALRREPERVPDDDRWETPGEVGVITDPIPHYNRGRTRLR